MPSGSVSEFSIIEGLLRNGGPFVIALIAFAVLIVVLYRFVAKPALDSMADNNACLEKAAAASRDAAESSRTAAVAAERAAASAEESAAASVKAAALSDQAAGHMRQVSEAMLEAVIDRTRRD